MLALVLFAAATAGPATDEPARAPAMCPRGDAPRGVMGALGHTRRLRTVDVGEGYAVVTFEDEIENGTDGAARIDLDVGSGGVVRAASIEEPGLAPRAARLDDQDAALALFTEYERALSYGVALEEAKDSVARAALLVEQGRGDVPTISVAMPCSVRRVVVRVEVLLPSVPVDGAWRFSLGGAPGEGVMDDLLVDSERPIRVQLEGASLAPGTQTTAPMIAEDDEDGALTLVVKPLDGPRLRTRGFAMLVAPTALMPATRDDDTGDDDTGDDAAAMPPPREVASVVIARAELDLPRPLADAPAGLRLVFVVDASVSVGAKGLEKALQIVHGILDEAPPDARFAIVTAGRRPRVVVPAWQAREDRALPSIALENGSDVLAALKKARAIAGDVGDEEVARVIAVSDMKLRFVDDDPRVAAGFASPRRDIAPLTHLVVLPDDADIEQPLLWSRAFADDDPRAAGPESTGGIWVDAGGEDEATLFPHLIRPTRVDRPRVTLAGLNVLEGETIAHSIVGSPRDPVDVGQGSDALPAFLVEGSGLRVEVGLPKMSTRDLRIGGLLWATPLDESVRTDETLLGLLAVDAIGVSLDDDLVRTIAQTAGTVSRVTSLVEVPEFRPGTDALMGFGGSGGSCCCGCRVGSRCGMRGTTCSIGVDLKERETLEALLREDARACLVHRSVLDVEFGDMEILDIEAIEGGPCVVERFWQRRLDVLPHVSGAFLGHREITVGTDARDE